MSKIEEESTVALKENDCSQKIITIPNIISFARIFLIIPFVYFFLNEKYIEAFSFIVVSGLSDCFDGLIARKLNQISELGKLLDPIADKLTLVAVVICLGICIPAIFPLVIALVVKDFSMLVGGLLLLCKGVKPPAAKWYGKLATMIFYISVVTVVFTKGVLGCNLPLLTGILLTITMVAMMFALVKYAIMFLKIWNENKSNNKKNCKDIITD